MEKTHWVFHREWEEVDGDGKRLFLAEPVDSADKAGALAAHSRALRWGWVREHYHRPGVSDLYELTWDEKATIGSAAERHSIANGDERDNPRSEAISLSPTAQIAAMRDLLRGVVKKAPEVSHEELYAEGEEWQASH